MASYNDTILTNSGLAILNRVLAGKCTVTFTRAVSSIADYSGKTLSELQTLTSLESIEQNGVATRFDVRSKTMVSIDLLFTNKDLQNSYEIKTIGLYAKASDSNTEVLYAVTTASDPETMPAYVDQKLAKFTLTLYTKVGQADKTSITITDEGVVKSINGSLTPDVNGDVTIDDSSHAKFIEAELINGHLLVPLVDDSGNPVTDPAGNQLVADEYLPKSIKLGNNPAIYPGTDNTVKLPVYTQAEIDNRLEVKADLLQMEDEHDALQEQITDNTSHLGNVDSTLGKHAKQIADNASRLGDVDNMLGKHTKQISQATGEASYALDQISTGQTLTALSDGQGGYLTDESGNALVSETRAVTSVNGKVPAADGNVAIDTYSKQEINNLIDDLKRVSAANLASSQAGAGTHNSIYRDTNLGSALADAQAAAIKAGTFDGLFIGGYWTIGGVTYRIAAFDYYLSTGDNACTDHHVVVVPDVSLYSAKMNQTNTTAGAYVGSEMYATGLSNAKTTITAAFGSAHLLTHRNRLQNECTNGVPTGTAWYDSTVDLMTEQNLYGSQIMGALPSGGTVNPWDANGNHNYLIDKSQFPLFAFRPDLISNRQWFWLRTVVSDTCFALSAGDGVAICANAGDSYGVRPAFSIC